MTTAMVEVSVVVRVFAIGRRHPARTAVFPTRRADAIARPRFALLRNATLAGCCRSTLRFRFRLWAKPGIPAGMKISAWTSLFVAAAAVGVLSGCSYFRRKGADQTESTLAAAGFQVKLADTPKRQAGLARFPTRKIVTRMRDGQLTYFYADPDFCKCLYYGDQQAYARFRALAIQQRIAQEEVDAAAMNEDTAMDWGMWGPFW